MTYDKMVIKFQYTSYFQRKIFFFIISIFFLHRTDQNIPEREEKEFHFQVMIIIFDDMIRYWMMKTILIKYRKDDHLMDLR